MIFPNEPDSFVCTQLNGFEYCYRTLIDLFDITHLFAHGEDIKELQLKFNNSVQQYLFIYT